MAIRSLLTRLVSRARREWVIPLAHLQSPWDAVARTVVDDKYEMRACKILIINRRSRCDELVPSKELRFWLYTAPTLRSYVQVHDSRSAHRLRANT